MKWKMERSWRCSVSRFVCEGSIGRASPISADNIRPRKGRNCFGIFEMLGLVWLIGQLRLTQKEQRRMMPPKPFCHMPFFVKGLIVGFSIAAPVGPIGLLCIRRTLAEGKLSGFMSGLGAATADATYGLIAAFGLTAISTLLLSYKLPIALVGGFFLLYLAVTTFIAQ